MKTETHMDYLLQKLESLNALVDLREDEDADATEERESKGKGKKGGKQGQGGGFFGTVVSEMFFRHNGAARPRIIGITHPSDGHPQEELTPDFGWFRALSYNNPTWTLYWPELII